MCGLGRYAMREALALIGDEGLEKLWEKHQRLHLELWAGLKEMGLEPFVEDPKERLVTVNCIKARPRLRSCTPCSSCLSRQTSRWAPWHTHEVPVPKSVWLATCSAPTGSCPSVPPEVLRREWVTTRPMRSLGKTTRIPMSKPCVVPVALCSCCVGAWLASGAAA